MPNNAIYSSQVIRERGVQDAHLGNQLDLDVNGTTLMGKPGRRVVFGCSKGFHHTLAPDCGSITFSSTTDLAGRCMSIP
jgi:hypothetical protein